jgi:DNA-binding IclR family transcriptional regulator
MLAFAPPQTVALALSVPPSPRTRYSIESPLVFGKELEEIRRIGHAVDREEVRLGLTCVAAPILRRGQAIGAVSLSAATHSFEPEAFARGVRQTAKDIAARLA